MARKARGDGTHGSRLGRIAVVVIVGAGAEERVEVGLRGAEDVGEALGRVLHLELLALLLPLRVVRRVVIAAVVGDAGLILLHGALVLVAPDHDGGRGGRGGLARGGGGRAVDEEIGGEGQLLIELVHHRLRGGGVVSEEAPEIASVVVLHGDGGRGKKCFSTRTRARKTHQVQLHQV